MSGTGGMMYSQKEFDEWIRQFAKVQVTIPRNKQELAYDIPMPKGGMSLRVYPKIDLHGEWMGSSPELEFVSAQTSVFIDAIPNPDDWRVEIREKISTAMRNWRELITS